MKTLEHLIAQMGDAQILANKGTTLKLEVCGRSDDGSELRICIKDAFGNRIDVDLFGDEALVVQQICFDEVGA